jgi:hypothetical protein
MQHELLALLRADLGPGEPVARGERLRHLESRRREAVARAGRNPRALDRGRVSSWSATRADR